MKIARTETLFNHYMDNYLIACKKDFFIDETNGTKKAVWDEKKNFGMFYKHYVESDVMPYLWIFNLVKVQFKRYIELNPKYKVHKNFPSVSKNTKAIEKFVEGEVFLATDINHCYWRVAYLEGYINYSLYKKGLPENDSPAYDVMKLLRNKSLACVKSTKKRHHYKKGKLVKTEIFDNVSLEELYGNVRNISYQIMDDIRFIIKKGFIKYKVDCIYYMPEYKDVVEGMMIGRDVGFKTNECIYIGDGYFIENDEVKKL